MDLNMDALVDTSRINAGVDLERSGQQGRHAHRGAGELRWSRTSTRSVHCTWRWTPPSAASRTSSPCCRGRSAARRGERVVEGAFFSRARLEGNDWATTRSPRPATPPCCTGSATTARRAGRSDPRGRGRGGGLALPRTAPHPARTAPTPRSSAGLPGRARRRGRRLRGLAVPATVSGMSTRPPRCSWPSAWTSGAAARCRGGVPSESGSAPPPLDAPRHEPPHLGLHVHDTARRRSVSCTWTP
ncbi:hypothetical protein QJS66_22240 [Kocuria rhizophila]|nr:hypothetical protein QJS66_22240 [Kocuria rhizophila]